MDIITTGDHLWDQKEVIGLLDRERRFVRPLNYPPGTPGQGSAIFQAPGLPPVAVLNLQGRTFMPILESPFLAALAEVERLRQATKIIFVDFHAEATSEKAALARMLDGRVSAVIGTHTHVQTADEQIFPGGTAFLSDGGFTGPHESVLGREIEPIIRRFMTNMPQKFEVAKGRVLLQGAVVEIDEQTGPGAGHSARVPGRVASAAMAKPAKSQWDFGELFPPEEIRKVLSVTELTWQIKRLLEQQVGEIWVTGEVTNFRLQSSGHIYFTLKDAGAQLNCILFRSETQVDRSLLQDGRKVTLAG